MNPAYVEWVLMVKDGEEKLVHPGNVESHENAGWTRKYAPAEPTGEQSGAPSKTTSLSLPELTDAILADVETKKLAKKAKAEAKKAKAESVE